METAYFASLNPPAVYRVDGFGMLEEVYVALPETPTWARAATLDPAAVRASSVPITELDSTVILGAWSRRLDQVAISEAPLPATVASVPDPGAVEVPLQEPLRIERPLWIETDAQRVAAEEAQIRLSRRDALSAFRELSSHNAEPGRADLTWL